MAKTDEIIIVIDRMLRNIADPPTTESIIRQVHESVGVVPTRDMVRRYIERIEKNLPKGYKILRQPIVSIDEQHCKKGRISLRYNQLPPMPHLTSEENALLTNIRLLYQSVSNLPWLPEVRQLMEQMNVFDKPTEQTDSVIPATTRHANSTSNLAHGESSTMGRCLFLDNSAVSTLNERSMRYLGDLFDAALRHYSVNITYRRFEEDLRTHEVSVLAVKQDDRFWYAAVCNEKSLLRAKVEGQWPFFWLAVDRVEKVTLSDKPYLTTDVDWDEYFGQVIGITNPYNKPTEEVRMLVYGVMREYLQSAPLHSSQRTIPRKDLPDEPLEVVLQVKDNHELHNRISSLMSSVVVTAPQHLSDWQREVLSVATERINKTTSKK